ncbi:MAG: hypothetical protein Fur0016_20930 [Anaerolineales bacterium]
MNDHRGPWFIFTGLLLGLGIGIGVAWGVPQAQPVNTSPASLRYDFKNEYRYMIAAAYTVSGDLGRARARLATLADPDSLLALGEQAQRMLAQNSSIERVRILANLSEAIQSQPQATLAPETGADSAASASPLNEPTLPPEQPSATPTPEPTENPSLPRPTSTPTNTPFPTLPPLLTATLRPTRTATPTPGAPFTLVNQSIACDPKQPSLLKVNLQNALGQPAPGQELVITWFGGEEHFFTGFKNEIGPGYADFSLASGVEYALSLSEGRTRITGLIAPACADQDGKPYPGSILLEFQQP